VVFIHLFYPKRDRINRTAWMVAEFVEVIEREENLGAGACNHPNAF